MRVFTAALAIASGVIVLLGYFVPLPILDEIRLVLTDWAIVIAGTAVLVGILNLVAVQMEKIRTKQKNSVYGIFLVFSLVVTFFLGLLVGPENPYMRIAVDAVIIPVEAALMAILAVTLVYASIRLLRRRADLMTVIFLLTAVLFLIAILLTPFQLNPTVGFVHDAIIGFTGMFSRGGARGLLIGVALGTLLTGLRVLFGIDRPYGGN
jgi:hypothetical protein